MSVVIIAKRTNHVMKKTEELLKTIQSCKNYQDFISESRQELISVRKLGEAFQEILTQKKLKKSDVIRNSGIDRGYAYDILSDKKQPSRDKVLLLCLGASFSFEEVQTLLKQTGYPNKQLCYILNCSIIFSSSLTISRLFSEIRCAAIPAELFAIFLDST